MTEITSIEREEEWKRKGKNERKRGKKKEKGKNREREELIIKNISGFRYLDFLFLVFYCYNLYFFFLN